MFIVLLGPPGAGKGTQARQLAEALGLAHVATGNLLREAVRRREPLGLTAKVYLDRGELVPDGIMGDLIAERLDALDARAGVIFDGYPRTVAQARRLDGELARRGCRVDRVICLDVPAAAIMRRLASRRICPRCGAVYNLLTSPPLQEGLCDACGEQLGHRADDYPEVIRRRLDVYTAEERPLTRYYARRGVLAVIRGDDTPAAVAAAVLAEARRRLALPTAVDQATQATG